MTRPSRRFSLQVKLTLPLVGIVVAVLGVSVLVLVMLGLRTLIPWRWRPAGQGLIFAALIALNVYIFAAYVLPFTTTFAPHSKGRFR
mgnify:CR=1 FL=1